MSEGSFWHLWSSGKLSLYEIIGSRVRIPSRPLFEVDWPIVCVHKKEDSCSKKLFEKVAILV